jgi:hypothetical protein
VKKQRRHDSTGFDEIYFINAVAAGFPNFHFNNPPFQSRRAKKALHLPFQNGPPS